MRYILTAQFQVQTQDTSCKIHGGLSGTEAGFPSRFLDFSLLVIILSLMYTQLFDIPNHSAQSSIFTSPLAPHLPDYRVRKLVLLHFSCTVYTRQPRSKTGEDTGGGSDLLKCPVPIFYS